MSQLVLKRKIESLQQLTEYVDKFVSDNSLDGEINYVLNLTAEELFTNMVKYSTGTLGDIEVDLNLNDKEVVLTIVDNGVEKFDVNNVRKPDFDTSLEEKIIGGLGIHLIKEMMDKIEYEYVDNKSIITVFKSLEK